MNDLQAIDPNPKSGSSAAVVVGDLPLVHTEQLFAPASLASADAAVEDLFRRMSDLLETAGTSLQRVVRWHFYVANDAVVAAVQSRLLAAYPDDYRPAATYVAGKLAERDGLIGADCVAAQTETKGNAAVVRLAGAAVLPPTYKLYISGDARPGELEIAARGTLEGLENSLKFAGLDWSHVVQLKTFLQPIDAAEQVRRAIRNYLGERPLPVLSFVEWKSAGVPLEIELVAAARPATDEAPETVVFQTPTGMTSSPVFSRSARVNSRRTIYTSGLYGEGATDGEERVRAILRSLGEIGSQTNSDLRHLVKATYYCSSDESSLLLNKIRPEFYDPKRPPAASKAIVAGVGRPDRDLTVDMILVPKPAE